VNVSVNGLAPRFKPLAKRRQATPLISEVIEEACAAGAPLLAAA